jgi:hypothetical protein
MVVVVAGVPVEVESPLGPPELAWAPVITGDVIARGSTEVAVVIVTINIAVVVVVAGTRIPVVAPFWMPILAGAPVVAREVTHLGCGDGWCSYTDQSESGRHDERCCCAPCQCFHGYHHNTEFCAPAMRLGPTGWQCFPKTGVSNGIGVV